MGVGLDRGETVAIRKSREPCVKLGEVAAMSLIGTVKKVSETGLCTNQLILFCCWVLFSL
jgi:hypothetical protein